MQAQAVAGTPTLNLPNTSGTIPSTATSPLVLNPTTGNISCPTCATSVSAANPVVASRATAQTLNLSALSGLITLGYATAGNGGAAYFLNVGTTPFKDSVPTAGTIAGGPGYTGTGTYYDVPLSGGTCDTPPEANITVAGGDVTAVVLVNARGSGCSVGDVLTTGNTNIGSAGAASHSRSLLFRHRSPAFPTA